MVLFLTSYYIHSVNTYGNFMSTLNRNMMGPASSLFQATLTVTTGLSAPFNNLALIYKQQVAGYMLPLSISNHY